MKKKRQFLKIFFKMNMEILLKMFKNQFKKICHLIKKVTKILKNIKVFIIVKTKQKMPNFFLLNIV